MRHGKSSWDDYGLSDHERKLLDIGKEKTKKVADFLKEKGIKPDLILSSTATRAHNTSKIVAQILEYPIDEIKTSRDIYHADDNDIFDALFALDNSVNSVLIFGHNPTFTDFVNNFKEIEIDNLPTSGFAAISFSTDKWENIPNSKHKFEFLISPKMLKDK